MAGRSEELRTNLTVNDQASKQIDAVADKLERLEQSDPTVELAANDQASPKVAGVLDDLEQLERADASVTLTADDRASDDVDDLTRKLSRLSASDQRIVLQARADQATREIARIERGLRDLDRLDDDEIEVRITARDQAKAAIADVERRLAALDNETAEVEVDVGGDWRSQLSELDGRLGDVVGMAGRMAGPAGLAAIAGGFIAAADNAANLAIEAGEIARLTGDSVTEAGQLASVWKGAGFESKDLQDVILQLNGVLAQTPELAERLGINLNDGSTAGERFVEVARKLETAVSDATERGVLGSQLFGEEGVRQVNAVMLRVGDLGAAIENAPELISEEDVDRALEYQQRLADVKTQLGAIAAEVGGDALPVLSGLAAVLNGDVFKAEYWNPPSEAVVSFGTSLRNSLQAAIDQEAAIASSASTLERMIPAVQGSQAAVDEFNRALSENPEAAEAAAEANAQVDGAYLALEQSSLAVAAAQREVNLAQLEGASSAFDLESAQIDLANAVDRSSEAAATADEALADGTLTAEEKAAALRDARSAELDAAGAALAAAEAYAKQQGAAEGSDESLRLMADALQVAKAQYPALAEEIDTMIASLDSAAGEAEGVGAAIGDGVARGIRSRMDAVSQAGRELIQRGLASSKDEALIRSPSQLFADEVGAPISEGVAEGILDEADKIGDSLARAIEAAEDKAVRAAKDLAKDAAGGLADAFGEYEGRRDDARLNENLLDSAEALADAQDRLREIEAEHGRESEQYRDAVEAVSDAETRLKDARYDLAKASTYLLDQGPEGIAMFRGIAEAAGLTVGEIDGISEAYYRMVEAAGAAVRAEVEAAQQAQQASVLLDKFGKLAAAGFFNPDQLKAVSGLSGTPGAQLAMIGQLVADSEAFIAALLPKFHRGGVVPGAPGTEVPIMAQAGEVVGWPGQGGGLAVIVQPGGIVLQGTNLTPTDVTNALATYVRTNGVGALQRMLGM
jgi:hypothetical protein